MNRLPEAVNTKFTELFEALKYATDDLKIAGAEANLNGDFLQVVSINDHCRKLLGLEDEIRLVLKRFENTQKKPAIVIAKPQRTTLNRVRNSNGYLQVTLGGALIKEKTASETFVETLNSLGLERIAKLNKRVSGIPLLNRARVNGYQHQKQSGDWYVTTHFSNQTAKGILEDIAKELRVPLKVELVKRLNHSANPA